MWQPARRCRQVVSSLPYPEREVAIEILLAPAAHGKTAYTIARLRALPPLVPARVLVPDKAQAQALRRRLAQAGGALGVEVQTFYDLYADVLALAQDARCPGGDGHLPRLPPAVRHHLIRHIVVRLCDAGQLPYHAPLRDSPGFARLLADLFGELKRARVFPEDLECAFSPSPQEESRGDGRLAELARIYAAYQAWLIENGWMDADGQGWLAAIALEKDPALFSDLGLLVVDGFDEFNPTQLHILRLLARRAADTIVTLTGDLQNPNRQAHRRLARARAALVETLDVELTPLSTCSLSTCLPLAHLEQNLFEPNAPPLAAGDALTFLEAQNRAAEAREALRWLKTRIVREHVPIAETAVVARDVTPYRPFLEEVAAEFGMPLRFISAADLGTNPAVAALLNLLGLEPGGWMPRAMLDALTSPYFDWSSSGLQPGDAVRLDAVARAGKVVGGPDGREQWRETLRRLAERKPEQDEEIDDVEDAAPRYLPTGPEAERLAAVFDAIVARITPPSQATLREYIVWIEELIGDDPALSPTRAVRSGDSAAPTNRGGKSLCLVARARENPATAERDVAALRVFKDILRGLALADALLKVERDGILPYNEFLAELVQAVESATYHVPVEGEAILVASALQARGLTFDSVAVLGLAEGEFPCAEQEDVLLRESDRAWLRERGFAVEPRLQGDAVTLFYHAVTRARRRLLLCRPYLADDGQPWEPSPYWLTVQALFPDAPLLHIRPTDPVSDPASEQELGNPAAITSPSPPGDLTSLAAQLGGRFGPERPWSSSRLETYAKCPFYFWAAYVMELAPREPPRVGFDVLTLGNIYHRVLERLYARMPEGDPERLRAELPTVAREIYEAAPHDYGFRPSPLWERQQEELTRVLRRTLDALIEAAGEYRPSAQELPFGLKDKPPLVLERAGGLPLRIRGYIDRIDRAPGGRLRVIDYKAGSTAISARDLTEGHRLQLPLYALAAREALGAEVAGGFYWHVGSARPSSLRLENYEGGVSGAIEKAVEYALAIAAAVRRGEFAPRPPQEGCPPFCPALSFCEHYKPKAW